MILLNRDEAPWNASIAVFPADTSCDASASPRGPSRRHRSSSRWLAPRRAAAFLQIDRGAGSSEYPTYNVFQVDKVTSLTCTKQAKAEAGRSCHPADEAHGFALVAVRRSASRIGIRASARSRRAQLCGGRWPLLREISRRDLITTVSPLLELQLRT